MQTTCMLSMSPSMFCGGGGTSQKKIQKEIQKKSKKSKKIFKKNPNKIQKNSPKKIPKKFFGAVYLVPGGLFLGGVCSGGVYLVPGGVCYWGVYLVPGGWGVSASGGSGVCSGGMYMVQGVYLVRYCPLWTDRCL